ncbi:hypothetical protein ACFYP4_33070 [Streptomyces sp. NPDC005551]|uniref:hypothetical protein n=1 Tax=unclassified Streptomyces TaxID=2593676 RepID=UPI0033E08809
MADSTLQMRGSLHRDGARVELCVTDSLLRDFLALLGVAQEELNQRWNGQEISDFYADRARRR